MGQRDKEGVTGSLHANDLVGPHIHVNDFHRPPCEFVHRIMLKSTQGEIHARRNPRKETSRPLKRGSQEVGDIREARKITCQV